MLSIIPRLDEFNRRRGIYDRVMREVCDTFGALFVETQNVFSTNDLSLWSSDSLHISENYGLPTLLRLVENNLGDCGPTTVESGFVLPRRVMKKAFSSEL